MYAKPNMSDNLNPRAYQQVLRLACIPIILFSVSCSIIAPPVPPPPPPEPENRQPVINYITAQQQVTPLSHSEIKCVATDADNDTLVYSWASSGGKIEGSGPLITWIAPDSAGSYTITATVTDGKGGEVKDSVSISVTEKPNRAPVITLIVKEKGEEPVTFIASTPPITVKRFSTTEIECKAEDPDGDTLTYRWAATDGKIDGVGPFVQYIALATGDFAVTATVIDSRGAETKSSAYFHVPCCGGF